MEAQTSAWTIEPVFVFVLAASCFTAFPVVRLCGLRPRERCLVRLVTVTWTQNGENM